jgi:hypothetical protein
MVLAAAGNAGASGFSSLEERMSQDEFHRAGLDRLSPEELKALNDWLRAHSTTTTVYVTPEGTPAFYGKDSEREAVESRIDGPFTGWYGMHTTFKLENGQEWQQSQSGSAECGHKDHPKVKIKPMLMGTWLMYVESCPDSVRVERTK